MAAVLTELITCEEFDQELVNRSGIELIDGQVVELPMPGAQHGEVCVSAAVIFKNFVKRNKRGRVMGNDTFIRVQTDPARVRGADVCYVSYERLPAGLPTPRGMLIPPIELALEVKSPSDTVDELAEKSWEYISAGVQVAVLLNPDDDTATVFRENQEPRVYQASDELTLPDILPGFSVRVGEFFE